MRSTYVSAEEAARFVQSGDRVYMHEVAMTPIVLVEALVARAGELRDVETISIHTEGPAPHVAPRLERSIRHNALFVGANVRQAVNDGRSDYTPAFLSDIPGLFASRALSLDVSLLQVSPPDRHGICRLGVSVACARAAADHARTVIGLVNDQVPLTMGNSSVHVSRFAALVEVSCPLPTTEPGPIGEVERQIGDHVATLVPDCATLQMGIGSIPDAVLSCSKDRNDLGVHTEMFSDGLVDLASGRDASQKELIDYFPIR